MAILYLYNNDKVFHQNRSDRFLENSEQSQREYHIIMKCKGIQNSLDCMQLTMLFFMDIRICIFIFACTTVPKAGSTNLFHKC